MNRFGKTLFTATLVGAFSALALPANALLLTYDELVAGATPASGSPWLTANITDLGDNTGVQMTLDVGVTSPEFLTDIYFSLGSGADLSLLADPTTSPDISLETCNSNSKDPANTGPWQLCLAFAPNLHVDSPTSITFNLLGLSVGDFGPNASGWWSVAHIQGVQPNCSSWVGSDNGTGSGTPASGYTCTSVPEPGTLSLLWIGVVAIGASEVRRRRRAATAKSNA
jgi:hypothetical protein